MKAATGCIVVAVVGVAILLPLGAIYTMVEAEKAAHDEFVSTHDHCKIYLAYKDHLVLDRAEWVPDGTCPAGYVIEEVP